VRHRVRWRLATVALAATLAVTGSTTVAGANVRSQALYARGLIPFNKGQWDQAYQLFNDAVAADPGDAVALYYRGLTQARRGMVAAATQDIENALRLDPALPRAALDLGILYFDAQRYPEAKAMLERARQQPAERFTAALFLGLTQYRLGEYSSALDYFNEAKADPEVRVAATYYAGLTLLQLGDPIAARAQMVEVASAQPQSEMGRSAQAYLAGEAPVGLPGEKPWTVYGRLKMGYDSNVVIGPSSSNVAFANAGLAAQGDGFVSFAVGGEYTLLERDWGTVSAQYDFYQSVYFDLSQFDLQGHRLQAEFASRPDTLLYGVWGAYDFYLLDFESFFQEGLGVPWVAYAFNDYLMTQAYYRLRGRDFLRAPYDPGRDSINNAFGINQLVALGEPQWVTTLGYQFELEDTVSGGPQGRDFQYNGSEFTATLTVPQFWRTTLQVGYVFRYADYQFPNSRVNFEFARHDHANQVVIGGLHELTENVGLTLDYIGIFNGSNIVDFDYNRNIIAAGVQVRF
jgi:Tfp pilus assembly protein PilF